MTTAVATPAPTGSDHPDDIAPDGPDRRFWWWVGAAVLIGLVLRVAWGLWAAQPPQGLFDPARYQGYARAIADGDGYIEPLSAEGRPTAYYPPGYPWFLGIVTWLGRPLTDDIPLLGAMVQAVLGAASVALAAVAGRHLGGRRAGIVAAFGLALYPNLVFHGGALLGETLYIALSLAFAVLVVTTRFPHGLTAGRAAAIGVLLGLAVMVRPISLAVVPVLVLTWWLATRDRRLVLRSSLVALVAVGACIVPWTIRNAVQMDAFVAISTNTGDNLCIGNGPGADGSFSLREECLTDHDFLAGTDAEVDADAEKTRIALQAVADEPGRQPWLVWRRFYFTWIRSGDHDGLLAVQSYRMDRFIDPEVEGALMRVADAAYVGTLGAGLAGAVVLVRRRRPADVFWVGAAVVTAAVPLVFFGDARFKVPVIPLLIVAGAVLVRTPAGARAVSSEA